MEKYFLVTLIISFALLLYTAMLYCGIKKHPTGTKRMRDISDAIRNGASAFLKREYKILSIVVAFVGAVLLLFLDNPTTPLHEGVPIALSFVVGSLCSIFAGYLGMKTATLANVRTTQAARKSLSEALNVAFSSGSVMGFGVVGLGLFGLSGLFIIFTMFSLSVASILSVITGFGLGASTIALFARVGGGIFTKAADVGADLVGKVEKGIPEDDPRNPATIADNVGDNVGDVAGMGADLFESYAGSIIAAMVIGYFAFESFTGVVLPFAIATTGVIASVIGGLYVKKASSSSPDKSLKNGLIISSVVMMVLSYFVITYFIPGKEGADLFIATITGLIVGTGIGIATEYYTSARYKPTRKLSEASLSGTGTNIISGIALGYISTTIPILLIVVGIYVSYIVADFYGIAIAAVGMLSTLGYSLATDAYGPVADNAGGIAQMAKLPKKVRDRTDQLDSVGNTTAAIGKGFAVGSAALTALALFTAYMTSVGIEAIDISKPIVMVGLLLGGLLPFVFSALTMNAVGHAAQSIVTEVRRQFRQIKGLMKGKKKPDYSKCVDIATKESLVKMIAPSIIAIVSPVFVGLVLGADALGGMLAGSLLVGVLLAVFMANAGGAWDNAKKYIEEGHYGGKGSVAHKAAVVGDTVGDPFKDTSGPSLNILIKLMSIVSLVFVVLFI